MSKYVEKVFASMFHINFLEAMQQKPCMKKGNMEIIIEDIYDDGSPCSMQATHFIKAMHSQSECTQYEITMNPQTGRGDITLHDLDAGGYCITLTDKEKEGLCVLSYFVNDEVQEGDNVQVDIVGDGETVVVRIVNTIVKKVDISFDVVLCDGQGCCNTPCKDMQQVVRVCNEDGFDRCCTLNMENEFHVQWCDLCEGCYTIKADANDGDEVRFILDGGEETCENQYFLSGGSHQMMVVKQLRVQTQLTIKQCMYDACGMLCKPSCDASIIVEVSTSEHTSCVTLCEENDFCVTLYGLPPACYTICEVRCEDMDTIEYQVDEQEICACAQVMVCENSCHEVRIITQNRCCDIQDTRQEGSLRICKYMCKEDGSMEKPADTMQFTVCVTGCGIQESFYLNKDNNFCVNMAHLCIGEYTIQECSCFDYIVSYSINQANPTTSATICYDGTQSYDIAIINEERCQGSMHIRKYIRNEFGELVRPEKQECFYGSIRSYFCRYCFELNEDNDFCVFFDDLRFGSYTIQEEPVCEYQTSYQIDNGHEQKHARITIDDGCDHAIKIINYIPEKTCGILTITKRMETCDHQFTTPEASKTFAICVQSACFEEVYTLCESNSWCIQLEGLQEGMYQISECLEEENDVYYLINQEDSQDAIVCMRDINQEVCIIEPIKQSVCLIVRVMIKTANDALIVPCDEQRFYVCIDGDKDTKPYRVCLCAANNWCIQLDTLWPGMYQIKQEEVMGYTPVYCIHGSETCDGSICMDTHNEEITIINEENDCLGNVIVRGYGVQEDGQLCMPCACYEYSFEICGQSFTHTYTLRKENDFCISFDDLEEDEYTIRALEEEGAVRYRVQGCEVACARFVVGREDTCVDLIVEDKKNAILHIEACICDGGSVHKPNEQALFSIVLKGENCHELYELSINNDYCVEIGDLPKQAYEIVELQPTGRMHYEVNGVMQEDGCILFDEQSMCVRIHVEEVACGSVQIQGMVEDGDNILRCPNQDVQFEIGMKGGDISRNVVLNNENNFCVQLDDLPQGQYQLCVCEQDEISFLIDDCLCDPACFDVFEEAVHVVAVHHSCPCSLGSLTFHGLIEENAYHQNSGCAETISFYIKNKEACEQLILQDTNRFTQSIQGLKPGNYILMEAGENPLQFAMEGQCFDHQVRIALQGEALCVDVIACRKQGVTITLQSFAMDTCSCGSSESQDPCMEIHLYHEDDCETLVLEEANDFTCIVRNQLPGCYELCGQDGRQLRFKINGGCIQEDGHFQVDDEDIDVQIFYPTNNNVSLHVEACVEGDDGEFIKPCQDASYTMEITGSCIQTCVVLDEKNAWYATLLLPAGEYRVKRCNDVLRDAMCYQLNHCCVDEALVVLKEEDQLVTLLCKANKTLGSVAISKLLCDKEGRYSHPTQDEEFVIYLRKGSEEKQIILNKENHFYVCLHDIADGLYDIFEDGETPGTIYIVNNAAPSPRGLLRVAGNANTINIINPVDMDVKGNIVIQKYERNEQGMLVTPQQGSFQILVSKPDYNEIFIVSKENDYRMNVSNLMDGLYVVHEVDSAGATYIVNEGSEVDQASVEVSGNQNTVDIINVRNVAPMGHIQLTKRIGRGNSIMRPEMDASYNILVSKPGYHEVYALNQANEWIVDIENLEDGDYTVNEIPNRDDVTYQVNGGGIVNHAIVAVAGNRNRVRIINAGKEALGSIALRKYVHEEDSAKQIDPPNDYISRVHISSPGYQNVVTLQSENQFMAQLENLTPAQYVVMELDASTATTYQVDQGSEVDSGVVDVNGDAHQVAIVNTLPIQKRGGMHVEKYIREGNVLQRPTQGSATLFVSKPGYQQSFILDASNEWTVNIHDLENGEYVLDEVGTQSRVSFIINGGSEVHIGVVTIEDNEAMVMMINTMPKKQSAIEIHKEVRDGSGNMQLPTNDETFQVELRGDHGYIKMLNLNRENTWTRTIDDLENGYYEVQEMSDQGYPVSYIVDNGLETSNASLRLMDSTHRITIINGDGTTKGRLELNKLIKNADGTLIQPADGDQFFVQIQNDQIIRNVTLDSGNQFSAVIQDLPDGKYRIVEIKNLAYLTTYRVNDGIEQVNARVEIKSGTSNRVNIINEHRGDRNSIEVFKYTLDQDGNYLPPIAPAIYTFTITGLDNDIQETYELNVDNSWHRSLRTLPAGRYQVKEGGSSPFPIKYLIDSSQLRDQAIFTSHPGSTQVIGIINLLRNDAMGSLVLTKRMIEEDGSLFDPQGGEVFTTIVRGTQNYTVSLEPANNYTFTLENLAFGAYEVEEITNQYNVTYRINGVEKEKGIVQINTTATNVALIINEPIQNNVNASNLTTPLRNNSVVKVVIE